MGSCEIEATARVVPFGCGVTVFKMKLDKDILKVIFIFPVASQKCQMGGTFSIYYYKVRVTVKGQRQRCIFNILQGQSYCQRFFSNGANGILITLLERLY